MVSHHLPDPAVFWVPAAVLGAVAVWCLWRGTWGARLFAALLLVMGLQLAEFGYFFYSFAAGRLEGDWPDLASRLVAVGLLVLPILLVVYLPERRAWLPRGVVLWPVVGLLTAALMFVEPRVSSEWYGLGRSLVGELVFPLAGLFLALSVRGEDSRTARDAVLLLSLGLLVASLPTAIGSAVIDYERLTSGSRFDAPFIERIYWTRIVAGAAVLLTSLAALLVVAFQRTTRAAGTGVRVAYVGGVFALIGIGLSYPQMSWRDGPIVFAVAGALALAALGAWAVFLLQRRGEPPSAATDDRDAPGPAPVDSGADACGTSRFHARLGLDEPDARQAEKDDT